MFKSETDWSVCPGIYVSCHARCDIGTACHLKICVHHMFETFAGTHICKLITENPELCLELAEFVSNDCRYPQEPSDAVCERT